MQRAFAQPAPAMQCESEWSHLQKRTTDIQCQRRQPHQQPPRSHKRDSSVSAALAVPFGKTLSYTSAPHCSRRSTCIYAPIHFSHAFLCSSPSVRPHSLLARRVLVAELFHRLPAPISEVTQVEGVEEHTRQPGLDHPLSHRTIMFKSLAPVLARSARVRPLPRTALYPLAARYNSTSTTTPAPTRECPACHKPIPLPASPCHSCGALIRIPQGLSLHSLLSVSDPIPVAGKPKFDIQAELEHLPSYGYDLDPRELHIQFLRRQRDLHPDKHGAIGNDVDLAADLSGEVNKAYETLKSPLKRAEYIVSVGGSS